MYYTIIIINNNHFTRDIITVERHTRSHCSPDILVHTKDYAHILLDFDHKL